MIRDLRRIYGLVSDLIFLHHPLTLRIRYQFHCTLNRMLIGGPDPDKSQEEWNDKNRFNNWTLNSFVKTFKKNRRFRKHIIAVLEFEKAKLLKDTPIDFEELRDYEERLKSRKDIELGALLRRIGSWVIIFSALMLVLRAIFG